MELISIRVTFPGASNSHFFAPVAASITWTRVPLKMAATRASSVIRAQVTLFPAPKTTDLGTPETAL